MTITRRHRLSRRDPSPSDLRAAQGLNRISKELLVGLTGPAGCGKDSVASIMVPHGFHCYTLAAPLKRGIEAMLGLDPSVWEDRASKEQVIPWLGKSPRQLVQTLGTEWGRHQVHPELWVMLMLRRWDMVRASTSPRMVVTDVRFDNEAHAILTAGGTIWRVEREGVTPVAPHVSEKGVSPALVEGSIKNYGSLDDLRQSVTGWVQFANKRYAR